MASAIGCFGCPRSATVPVASLSLVVSILSPRTAGEIGKLMSKNRIFETKIVNSSHLTDADWAEINKLKRAFEDGGKAALSKAVEKLGNDPIRYVNVMAAFFPEMIREKLKESLADADADDVRELIQKLETPAIRPRICH
jgi:hypothetical protein